MAYQIGRGKHFHDTLELLGDDGQIALRIDVDLDLDDMVADFNHKRNRLIQAEQSLRKAQKENIQDVESCMEIYGEAVISIMSLILGEENARKILEYFEGRYIEMAQQIFPYLTEVKLF